MVHLFRIHRNSLVITFIMTNKTRTCVRIGYLHVFTKLFTHTRVYEQVVSQDLEIGCPNLSEISKQGVQIFHLQYFYM